MKGWDATQPDGLPEGVNACPACGALPCDWVNAPSDLRRETLNEVVETKAFIAELLEEVLSLNPLGEAA